MYKTDFEADLFRLLLRSFCFYLFIEIVDESFPIDEERSTVLVFPTWYQRAKLSFELQHGEGIGVEPKVMIGFEARNLPSACLLSLAFSPSLLSTIFQDLLALIYP